MAEHPHRPIGMFRNLTKLPDKAGRQDLDGVRVVEHDTNFGGPLVLTHRLPKLCKGGPNVSKLTKFEIGPFNLKNRKITDALMLKHFFWTCWLEQRYLHVKG